MKHVMKILIIFLVGMTVSCDRIVDFPAEGSGKVYVNALMTDNGRSRIEIGVCQPVGSIENAKPEEVTVILTADGDNVELTADAYDPERKIIAYSTDYRFAAGQKLSLKTFCQGLPDTRSEVVVPAEIPELQILRSEVESYKTDLPEQNIDKLNTLWYFNIRLDEKPEEESYFGVQIIKRNQFEYSGDVPDYEKEQMENKAGVVEVADLYVNGSIAENGELSSMETDMVIDFDGGETVIAKAKERDGYSWTDAWIEPGKRILYSSSYNPALGVNYAIYQYYEYKVRLYRLSSDTYSYLRGRYIIDNSALPVHLGFTPATYTYTNVAGGIGMCGAVTVYESEWTRYG